MATVHTGIALRLVRLVGVTHAPSIVAVNDGHLVHFKGYITTANLKQFLRDLLPSIVMVSVLFVYAYWNLFSNGLGILVY